MAQLIAEVNVSYTGDNSAGVMSQNGSGVIDMEMLKTLLKELIWQEKGKAQPPATSG